MSQQVSSNSQPCHIDNQDEQATWEVIDELLSRARSLSDEFGQGAEARFIEEAVALDREALALCAPGQPWRADCLSQLSRHLLRRYDRFGGLDNIEEAACLAQEAVGLRPPESEGRPYSLYCLALSLSARYDELGQAEDLNEAIGLNKQAMLLCPPGHPDRSRVLCSLVQCLAYRHWRLGGVDDLSEAIDLARENLKLSSNDSSRSIFLNNLGASLTNRYKLLGEMHDLNEAIDIHREVLELRPPGHPLRSSSLGNLADCFTLRFSRLGAASAGDLSEAIGLQREALELCPLGHPFRSPLLNDLANSLSRQYHNLGTVEDLNEAIGLYREALMLCPLGHLGHSRRLMCLANCLIDRYEQLHNEDDREGLFSLYDGLTCTGQSVSLADLSATRDWIRAAERFHHPTTILAYKTALILLVRYVHTLPSLPQHLATLRKQSSSLAMEAFSACLRNQSPTSSVELLEQGRGLSWNQLGRLRSPLDDVIASGPEGRTLADDYAHLTSLIRDALNSAGGNQHDQVCQLNMKLESTVSKIRTLPGLSHFLLPLPFSNLRRAAKDGPVVIVNAGCLTCDALVIVADNNPIHVVLSATQKDIRLLVSNLGKLTERAKKDEITKDLQAFLRDLWDQVVFPIADCLRSTLSYPLQSRVWWCPTAEFSLLPLHAAAPYRKGQKGFSDLYISSYTPSLSALMRARRSTSSAPTSHPKRFIAVGQANANGTNRLQSVGAELSLLERQLGWLTKFSSIEGQDSSISRVTEELGRNEWVHFACHGLPDRRHPFESAFALQDGRLTVRQISQLDPENAEFAYLSACHTTVGDEESPDESLHLAAAMQFAGFRSVIGTMWAVDDAQTNKITPVFYKHMVDDSGRLDHTRAAYALWKTARSVKVPLDQRILYIHIGA